MRFLLLGLEGRVDELGSDSTSVSVDWNEPHSLRFFLLRLFLLRLFLLRLLDFISIEPVLAVLFLLGNLFDRLCFGWLWLLNYDWDLFFDGQR